MAKFTPRYRLRVYAEGQGVGGTVLTPRAGAPHSDPFQIATATGVAGYQPYMMVPRGQRGAIHPLSKRQDQGSIVVDIIDKKTNTITDNLERWVTAFLGNTKGQNQLPALVCQIDEDTGSGWSVWFTGEIDGTALSGRTRMRLTVGDLTRNLDDEIFVTVPHTTVTNSFLSPVLPTHLVRQYGDFAVGEKIQGTARAYTIANQGSGTALVASQDWYRSDRNHLALMATQAAIAGTDLISLKSPSAGAVNPVFDEFRVYVKILSGARTGEEGYMRLAPGRPTSGRPVVLPGSPYGTLSEEGHVFLTEVFVREIDSGHPDYIAAPPDTVQVEYYVERAAKPTKAAPLFIHRTHPFQVLKDALDGKYGPLDEGGAVLQTYGYDATQLQTFIDDDTYQLFTGWIDEPLKLRTFIEEWICKPYNAAYRVDENGDLFFVDLRIPPSFGGLTTLTNVDIVAKSKPQWDQGRTSAISQIQFKVYRDDKLEDEEWENSARIPDFPPTGIFETDMIYSPIAFGRVGLNDKPYKIDGRGYRWTTKTWTIFDHTPIAEILHVRGKALEVARSYQSPFGTGAAKARLDFRRTANVTGLWPGDFCKLDIDELPDPATNLRGGVRVAVVLSRHEDGPVVQLGLLDYGPDVVAVGPTLGTLALTSGAESHSVDVPVTLNGDGEPVRLDVAITTTAVGTRPAEGSDLWAEAAYVTATGTEVVDRLPSGMRCWFRGRTEPRAGDDRKIPSGWVYPSGPDFADTTAIPAPSGLILTVLNGSEIEVEWTFGSASLDVMVQLDSDVVAVLPAGSTRYLLMGLDVSTLYTVTVWHRDTVGKFGPSVSDTATTTGTPGVAPEMIGMQIIVGDVV